MFSAKCLQVNDDDTLPVRIDKAGVGIRKIEFLSVVVICPSTMAVYSAPCDSYHVRIIQPARTAKSGQISDWACEVAVRGNEAIIRLDVFTPAGAVLVRPAFVGFQFAPPHC